MKFLKNYILSFLMLLVFTDSQAQILYNRAFGTAGWDAAHDIIIDHNNDFIMLGSFYENLYLAKSDTTTQLLWEKSYLMNEELLYPKSICEIGDSSFVMSGSYTREGFIFKVNSFGDTLFYVQDSLIYGNTVSKLQQAPDGNLLAMVYYNEGFHSLLKLDDELNIINRLDTITPEVRDFEVASNYIYVLKKDSLQNLLIIDDTLSVFDTISIPLVPVYLTNHMRATFDNQLIIDGHYSFNGFSPRKRYYTDLMGNIVNTCDSLGLYFTDFQTTDATNNILYAGVHYDATWGPDIQLYFINDGCENSLKDTILYRGGSFSNPWAEEKLVKMLVDVNGNYVLFGWADQGPLGNTDIFLMIYKKWEGFVTSVRNIENEPSTPKNTIVVYPNPFQEQFTVTGITKNSNITVMDVMGKIVYTQHSLLNTQHSIPTTNLAKGLYVVQIKNFEKTTNLKVVKQ